MCLNCTVAMGDGFTGKCYPWPLYPGGWLAHTQAVD